jgi:hypothetical protein
MSNAQQILTSPNAGAQLQPPQNPLIAMTQISTTPMSVAVSNVTGNAVITVTAASLAAASKESEAGKVVTTTSAGTTWQQNTPTTTMTAVVAAVSSLADASKAGESKAEVKTPTKVDKSKATPMEVDEPKKNGEFLFENFKYLEGDDS